MSDTSKPPTIEEQTNEIGSNVLFQSQKICSCVFFLSLNKQKHAEHLMLFKFE